MQLSYKVNPLREWSHLKFAGAYYTIRKKGGLIDIYTSQFA